MKKRRPNSPEMNAAFDRLLEAAVSGGVDARYPSGTTFVPSDAPHAAMVVSARTLAGGTVAMVHTDRVEVYLKGGPFRAESPPATVGSYPDFVRGASSDRFVGRLHPVVG